MAGFDTVAHRVAERFHDDGQRFQDDAGIELETVCEELAVGISHRERGIAGAPIRFEFLDGSSIVVGGEAWDFGLPGGCFCMEGNGHNDDCWVGGKPMRDYLHALRIEYTQLADGGIRIGQLLIYWDNQDFRSVGWAYRLRDDSGALDSLEDLIELLDIAQGSTS
mgnify:CR=1 FL=1